MPKKILTFTAFLVLVFILSACSKTTSNNNKTANTNNSVASCAGSIKIGDTLVEKDPAGDPEAWVRFDYTSTATQKLNCQYTLTFYDSQEKIIRTIPNIEDTFEYPSGQLYNGYSNTPFQSGMTARIAVE
ncbi:MAG: hypothetical protein WCV50_05925 [Patescibacteria group bacterium]